MLLRVRCQCGKVLKLTDRSVGRLIPCPACGAKVPIPRREDSTVEALEEVPEPVPAMTIDSRLEPLADADADLYDFVPPPPPPPPPAPAPRPAMLYDGPPCPACRKPLPADARICVHCGVDLATGRPVNETAARIDRAVATVSWFLPLGLFPFAPTDPAIRRSPVATWLIVAATVILSAMFFVYLSGDTDPEPAVLNLQLWTGNARAFERKTTHLVDMMERRIKQQAREQNPQGVLPPDVSRDARRRATTMAASITGVPEGVGFRLPQVMTYAFLHDASGGFAFTYHLLGSVIFLLVFGLALDAVIGSGRMLIVYGFVIVAAAATDLLFNASQPLHPCVGAAGAVSALAGMYAVFFGAQLVNLVSWARLRTWWDYKAVPVRGFWVVAAWFVYNDVIPALAEVRSEDAIIPHATHAIVFAVGAVVALGMLATGIADLHGGDVISRWRRKSPPTLSP